MIARNENNYFFCFELRTSKTHDTINISIAVIAYLKRTIREVCILGCLLEQIESQRKVMLRFSARFIFGINKSNHIRYFVISVCVAFMFIFLACFKA